MNPNNPQSTSFDQTVSPPASPQLPYEAPARKPTGLAVASLVLSIVGLLTAWIFGIGILLAIVALVLGILSLVKKRGGKGMSIAGITISAITILLGMILIPIIIVAYSGIQDRAQESMNQESAAQVRIKAESYNAVLGTSEDSHYPTFTELIEGNTEVPEATLDSSLIDKLHDGDGSTVSGDKPVAYQGCSNGAYVFYYSPSETKAGSYSLGNPLLCKF